MQAHQVILPVMLTFLLLSSYMAHGEIQEENRQHYIKGKWHWCILDYICCEAFVKVVHKLSQSHYFGPQALWYSEASSLCASAVKNCNTITTSN